jgi:hypothetical protein
MQSRDHHVLREAVVPLLSVRSVGAVELRRSKAVSRMQDAVCSMQDAGHGKAESHREPTFAEDQDNLLLPRMMWKQHHASSILP